MGKTSRKRPPPQETQGGTEHSTHRHVHRKLVLIGSRGNIQVVRRESWAIKRGPRQQVCNLLCKRGQLTQDLLYSKLLLESVEDEKLAKTHILDMLTHDIKYYSL